MIYAGFTVLANIFISLALFQYLGYLGIAIATTISSWINLILLYRESAAKKYFIFNRRLLNSIIKITIASAGMILILFLIEKSSSILQFSEGYIVNFLILSCYIFIGIMFYGIICQLLKIIELKSFFRYVR
tara:strand:- start:307 stop:699 length:393 start_codon:yes stop_codon:yes gene_type:complete